MTARARRRVPLHDRDCRATDDLFRRCFGLGLIGLAVTSPRKGILEANDELCRILGYDRAELLQMTWAELTHPDDLAADVAQYDRVIAGEIDGYCLDKRWIRKDGAIVDSIMSAHCERHADGSIAYFLGLVQNITARKRAEREMVALKNTLRDLTRKLIEEQDAQSRHVARELHDVFTQRLTAIAMELTRVANAPFQGSRLLSEHLRNVAEQIGTLAGDIHQISRQIHPSILDDLGLAVAIRSECLAFAERYHIATGFESGDIPRDLRPDVTLCLYRITQESLRNIAQHAGESTVAVRLTARPGEIVLTIDDTGSGFDSESGQRTSGLGLVSMEERLRIVGGRLSVRSRHGSGTHVTASVPIRS
jgi:PAS domain S-box-containing protein